MKLPLCIEFMITQRVLLDNHWRMTPDECLFLSLSNSPQSSAYTVLSSGQFRDLEICWGNVCNWATQAIDLMPALQWFASTVCGTAFELRVYSQETVDAPPCPCLCSGDINLSKYTASAGNFTVGLEPSELTPFLWRSVVDLERYFLLNKKKHREGAQGTQ